MSTSKWNFTCLARFRAPHVYLTIPPVAVEVMSCNSVGKQTSSCPSFVIHVKRCAADPFDCCFLFDSITFRKLLQNKYMSRDRENSIAMGCQSRAQRLEADTFERQDHTYASELWTQYQYSFLNFVCTLTGDY